MYPNNFALAVVHAPMSQHRNSYLNNASSFDIAVLQLRTFSATGPSISLRLSCLNEIVGYLVYSQFHV